MPVSYSHFAQNVKVETAFTVLQIAKQLQAQGKDVIELEIGDSPFPTTSAAKAAGIEAIEAGHTHYGPSSGLGPMRDAAAALVKKEFNVEVGPENVVIGPGAKIFELLFCEAFLDADDGVTAIGKPLQVVRLAAERNQYGAAGGARGPVPAQRAAAAGFVPADASFAPAAQPVFGHAWSVPGGLPAEPGW